MINTQISKDGVHENEKIVFIHILRGLAPLVVLWAHVPGLWLLERNEVWSFFQHYKLMILAPLQISDGGGHLGVVIFFLISGYIISVVAEKETRSEFLVKRIFRLFPALLVCTAISYILFKISSAYGLGPIYGTDAVDLVDFVKSAFMLSWFTQSPRALSVAWSLMPEIIFYAIVFLLLTMMRRSPVISTLWMLFAYAILAFPMKEVPYLAYFGYFTVYMPMFYIGRILYLNHHKKISGQQAIALLFLCVTVFLSVYTNRFPGELFKSDSGKIWNFVLGTGIFYGMMISGIRSCPRLISFFADISYALYLVHLPLGMFLLNVMASIPMQFSFKCFIAIVSSIGLAAIIHHLVEKPAQRYARYLLSQAHGLFAVRNAI